MRFLLALCCMLAMTFSSFARIESSDGKPLVGMYIHQHWAYNQPYSARTWTFEQWQAYLRGLDALGFNLVMIWPMLETIPNPMTPSDKEHLQKIARVIRFAQDELGFKVIVVLCGNVAVVDEIARRQSFYERNYFYCDYRFDLNDEPTVDRVLAWRRQLLEYLKATDGVAIIDSDPSGYAGSTNEEFIALLAAHRPIIDALRPGIEMLYWINAPWVAYNRFYESGKFKMGSKAEFQAAIKAFADRNLEPFGFMGSAAVTEYATEIGLDERFITLTYGVIEGEPTFPLTRYTPGETNEAARKMGPRGTLGNAQTHMHQLPNTFAFGRGAHKQTATEADMTSFADQLLKAHGSTLVTAWQAIHSGEQTAIEAALQAMRPLRAQQLAPGKLAGLIFNDPARYVEDLILQLELALQYQHFLTESRGGGVTPETLRRFIDAAERWQLRHGYSNRWHWEELVAELKKVDHPAIRAVLADGIETYRSFGGVNTGYFREETATPRLLRALRAWQYSLETHMVIPADAGIPQRRPD